MPKTITSLRKEISKIRKKKQEDYERDKLEEELRQLKTKTSKLGKFVSSPRIKSNLRSIKKAIDRAARNYK